MIRQVDKSHYNIPMSSDPILLGRANQKRRRASGASPVTALT